MRSAGDRGKCRIGNGKAEVVCAEERGMFGCFSVGGFERKDDG